MVTQQNQYSLTELENMMPWEREAYLTILTQQLKEQNDRAQEAQAQQNG